MSKVKSYFNSWCKMFQKRGDFQNGNEYRLYDEFSLLAKNRFKWNNLPEGIESRHIENFLFRDGQVAFFKHELNGFMCLPCSPNGQLNFYGDALSYNVVGIGFSECVKSDDIVRILCNDNATPIRYKALYYASLIDEIETSAFMNIKQQRYPWFIGTTKENELTLRAIFDKIDEGEHQIFVDSRLSQGGALSVESLKTNTPYVVDNLRTEKNEVINEYLSWLGLNNTQNNKRERMLVDEINVNNNQILMNLDIEFKLREKACEEINEKFGLDISVEKTIDDLQVDFMGQQVEDRKSDEKRGWFK